MCAAEVRVESLLLQECRRADIRTCSSSNRGDDCGVPGFLVQCATGSRAETDADADMSFSEPQEALSRELSCPICLQLFCDPVVLPCGHHYCRACVRAAAAADGGPPHPCPECREEYPGPEALPRSFKLCGIVEGYKTATRARGGANLLCERCPGEGAPAAKACPCCEAPLCPQHLRTHLEVAEGDKDGDSDPPCPLHRRPPEYFCGGDGAFLCAACLAQGGHRDHDVKTLEAAEAEFRRALEAREKEARGRLLMAEALAQRAAGDRAVFEAANEKLEAKALGLLGGIAEQTAGYRARLAGLLAEERHSLEEGWREGERRLEEQRGLLGRAQRDAAAALRETHPLRFVRRYLETQPAIRAAAGGWAAAPPAMAPAPAPLDVKKLASAARTEQFRAEMARLLQSLAVLLSPLELTFNPNTAHPSLLLSNDLRTVRYASARQPVPDHSERFGSAPQVLCAQGFASGEHVWVVETGPCMWSVGLSYRSVPRRGDHSRLGHNAVSWRVQWKNRKLTACHASCNVVLAETAAPVRVEVALDYEGGTLSFHSIAGRRQHLHTFRASFRETVYPAFSIHSTTPESWITLQS